MSHCNLGVLAPVALALGALMAAPAHPQGGSQADPFADLLAGMSLSEDGDCRVGILNYRIQAWREGATPPAAFGSVSSIMTDDRAPLQRLEEMGCRSNFLWSVLACTQLDNPGADHLVSRGISAETDEEFVDLLTVCMATLDNEGISPR